MFSTRLRSSALLTGLERKSLVPASMARSMSPSSLSAVTIRIMMCLVESSFFSLSQTSFDCTDVGTVNITMTVTDAANNSDNCTATVTIEDNVLPNAICQDITVQLDANGNASLNTTDIDNGSNDNCGIANLSISQTTFSCSEIGTNTVTLTVTDVNANLNTCDAIVAVEDNVIPNAICQNLTVQLDANGAASISDTQVNNGSNDNCGTVSYTHLTLPTICSV